MTTVYTLPACVQCDMTKRYLDRAGVDYDTVDISQNPEAYDKIVQLGFSAAPVVISGDNAWSGFQPDRLDSLVAQGIINT